MSTATTAGDQAYFSMASNPTQFAGAPFGYRILTPVIVWLLPVEATTGFVVVNILSLATVSSLLYIYLEKLNFNEKLSQLGMLSFLLSPMVLIYLWEITSTVDPLSYVFLMVGLIAIRDDNILLLSSSIFIGMLAKETTLLLVGIYGLKIWFENGIWAGIRQGIPIGIAGIIPYLGIRLIFGFESYYTISEVIRVLEHLQSSILTSPIMFLGNIYIIFGSLWILFPFGSVDLRKPILTASLVAIIPVSLQIFLGVSTTRLLFLGFPILIPISLVAFSEESTLTTMIALVAVGSGILGIVGGGVSFILGVGGLVPWVGTIFGIHELVIAYFCFQEYQTPLSKIA
ncbi:hypothetical protein [Haloplanus halobius]|uniref:hypothetical protein n=1 Tax=Haloplanus halobius TaxID=2934938 RepID=UPI00200D8831|nr:hypothetical protein [Haloplanus sp. XH21]